MSNISISYFIDILKMYLNKDELKKFIELYKKKDFQAIFNLSTQYDIPELVSFLYENYDVCFYINEYIKRMDKNLYEELNSENQNNLYKILVIENKSESFQYLLDKRKYSKVYKDKNGFYYKFNKI